MIFFSLTKPIKTINVSDVRPFLLVQEIKFKYPKCKTLFYDNLLQWPEEQQHIKQPKHQDQRPKSIHKSG